MDHLPDNNPKSLEARKKPGGFDCIPPVALLHQAAAHRNGGGKYGPMNWRETNVSAKVYFDAMLRHFLAWWDGEDYATDSGVHHLAHMIAGANIILDALAQGTLIDDRPPPGVFARLLEEWATLAAHDARPPEDEEPEDEEPEDEEPEHDDWEAAIAAGEEPEDDDDGSDDAADGFAIKLRFCHTTGTLLVECCWGMNRAEVEVHPEVSRMSLQEKIRAYISKDLSRHVAMVAVIERHLGRWRIQDMDQSERMRAAFYIDAWAKGVPASLKDLDTALKYAGVME